MRNLPGFDDSGGGLLLFPRLPAVELPKEPVDPVQINVRYPYIISKLFPTPGALRWRAKPPSHNNPNN
jgi:hypothetical protein